MKPLEVEEYPKCPFFRRCQSDGVYSVCCEGLTPDGGLKVWFRRPESWERHYKGFCSSSYKHCEIYEAVMKAQYPDDWEAEQNVLHKGELPLQGVPETHGKS